MTSVRICAVTVYIGAVKWNRHESIIRLGTILGQSANSLKMSFRKQIKYFMNVLNNWKCSSDTKEA